MTLKNDPPISLSVQKVLSKDNYIIPIYQRNYAWEEGEITQLIQDVIDFVPKTNDKPEQNEYPRNYYIGTLVVFERPDGAFETIDGQQRLTTLSLLSAYLKNEKSKEVQDVNLPKGLNLHFDSRPNSQNTLDKIFKNEIHKLNPEKHDETNTAILNGYELIKKNLQLKLKENGKELDKFEKFLFENVQIMRVKVPEDTDLNHYFEIMNNRGEQLEKHEVLKSRMMEAIKDEDQNCLHLVWEACANMEKYVQMGFSPEQRNAIFGDNWSSLEVTDFCCLKSKLFPVSEAKNKENEQDQDIIDTNAQTIDKNSLDYIINNPPVNLSTNQQDEFPERFNTVINFPNFLLHVLRVQTEQDVPLDDKRLISTFESTVLKGEDVAEKVRKFTFDLLRCKFLYDQYIIKREFIKGADRWSLKRLKKNNNSASYVNTFGQDDEESNDKNINRQLLMLIAAFHVSNPSQSYKYWLDGALAYLYRQEKPPIDATEYLEYLEYLEGLAKSFVFDRFLSANSGWDYRTMIYANKGKCQATVIGDETKLSFGNIENNLVFNFLDYLLWKDNEEAKKASDACMGIVPSWKDNEEAEKKEKKKDPKITAFEFTFRSSVEHYYPQHPLSGQNLPSDILNSFGNLCLISHSKNSRLSNFMPEAKKEYYRNSTIDSVKQYFMMDDKPWNEASIKTHFKEMKSILLKTLDSADG